MMNRFLSYAEEVEIDRYRFQSNRTCGIHYRQPRQPNCCATSPSMYRYSDHAQLRVAQRGLSPDDVLYILRYGRSYHAADAIFYLLVGKDIPENERHKMSRLSGTAVIVSKDHSTIITVWRNRQNGTRNIRRKLSRIQYPGAGAI